MLGSRTVKAELGVLAWEEKENAVVTQLCSETETVNVASFLR